MSKKGGDKGGGGEKRGGGEEGGGQGEAGMQQARSADLCNAQDNRLRQQSAQRIRE